MTAKQLVLPIGLILLIASSCVRLTQRIKLTDANTGEFAIECRIPSAAIKAIQETQPLPWLDPETGGDAFAKSDGFRLTRYRVYQLEEYHHVKIEGRLIDARKALNSGKLGPFTWKHANGAGSIRMKLEGPPEKESSGTADKELRQVLKDFRCELILELPGEPIATTAHTRDGRTLTWIFDGNKTIDFARSLPDVSAAYKSK